MSKQSSPGGYLVKDFGDGWYWTPNAALDHAGGALIWSVEGGRYETDPPAIVIPADDPEASVDAIRTMDGETVGGFKVAAWRYIGPQDPDDARYGHRYCEHWSSVGNAPKKVERLFTEGQLRAAMLSAAPAPDGGAGFYTIKAAIERAMMDERDGKPCGCIIEAGCEERGYADPAYAASGFIWAATDAVMRALATREEAPERRECDECCFKGTSDDRSKEQDYCTACGGNSPAGGPDECAHCGAKNHMVMACPKCGGRFSLDEDAREEAPADDWEGPLNNEERAMIDAAWEKHKAAQPQAREDAQPVAWRCSREGRSDGLGDWYYRDGAPNPSPLAKNVQALFLHPAPDALRVAVEALEGAKQIAARLDGHDAEMMADEIETIDQALAVLQAEQKGGA